MMQSLSFTDYEEKLVDYHLYASKMTNERAQIRSAIVELLQYTEKQIPYHNDYLSQLNNIDDLLTPFIKQALSEIHGLPDYSKLQIKYEYMIIDYLFFTPIAYNTKGLDELLCEIADICRSRINQFVTLHEFAVISWYDNVISPNHILTTLKNADLNQTEFYHILGEMSLRYPLEVVRFQEENKTLDDYYSKKFIQKLRRSRSRPLAKDMDIKGSLDDINELIGNYLQ